MYPIIETRQLSSEYDSCNRCGWVQENKDNPVPITEITLRTSEFGGMAIRYCDKHLAELLTELTAAVEDITVSRLNAMPKETTE